MRDQGPERGLTYNDAGVSIAAAEAALDAMGPAIRSTHDDYVLGGIGPFASALNLGTLLRHSCLRHPLLCQSIDGPGTMPILAKEWFDLYKDAEPFKSIGWSVAAHCFADLACVGAQPITLLDNIGSTDVDPAVHEHIIEGLAECCRDYSSSGPWLGRITGGEIAQLPGLIVPGQTDFCVCATGLAEFDEWLNPLTRVKPGDLVLGIEAGGFHLNGSTLLRKIRDTRHRFCLNDRIPGSNGDTVNQVIFARQPNYGPHAVRLLSMLGMRVHGYAHITGGGLPDNVKRCLPEGCRAVIDSTSWEVPAFFRWLMEIGPVEREEAYHTWNMGVGFVQIIDPAVADDVIDEWKLDEDLDAFPIGEIVEGERDVEITF